MSIKPILSLVAKVHSNTAQSLGRAVAAVLLIALINSCSSPSSNPDDGGLVGSGSGGGIGGSGFAQGEITGFGSVIINGFRYTTDNALFNILGEFGDQSSLQVGMTVSADVDFDTSAASRVTYLPVAIGPLESIDIDQSTVSVFGRSIFISTRTLTNGLSLQSLNVGDIIEISGIQDGTGRIEASYMRSAESTEAFYLQGVVERTSSNGLSIETLITANDSDGDGIDDAFDVDQTGGLDVDGDGIDDITSQFDLNNNGIPDIDELNSNEGVELGDMEVIVNGEVVSIANLRPEVQSDLFVGDTVFLRIPRDSFQMEEDYTPTVGFFDIGELTFDIDETTVFLRADGTPASQIDFGTGARVIVSGFGKLLGIIDVAEIVVLEPVI